MRMNALTPQMELLSKLLDVAVLRHRVIAQNVANVNTPGYRRQEVLFEDSLADTLHRGNDGDLNSVQPRIVDAAGDTTRADGNTVDIDDEMGRLDKNSHLYRMFAQILTSRLTTMRSAITGQ
jgi:flagellar basal-body rod protein FlgB